MLLDQVVLNIYIYIYIYNICELWYKLLFVICHCVIVNDVQPEPCCGINPGQHHGQSRMHIQWNHRMFVNKSWCKPNSKPFTKKHISVNMCKHCFQTVSKEKNKHDAFGTPYILLLIIICSLLGFSTLPPRAVSFILIPGWLGRWLGHSRVGINRPVQHILSSKLTEHSSFVDDLPWFSD